jgi:hypothetical protein
MLASRVLRSTWLSVVHRFPLDINESHRLPSRVFLRVSYWCGLLNYIYICPFGIRTVLSRSYGPRLVPYFRGLYGICIVLFIRYLSGYVWRSHSWLRSSILNSPTHGLCGRFLLEHVRIGSVWATQCMDALRWQPYCNSSNTNEFELRFLVRATSSNTGIVGFVWHICRCLAQRLGTVPNLTCDGN